MRDRATKWHLICKSDPCSSADYHAIAKAMQYAPDALQSESIAEFDLTLIHPGKWTLKAPLIPERGYWFARQRDALSMAFGHLSRGHAGAMVRIHNEWGSAVPQ